MESYERYQQRLHARKLHTVNLLLLSDEVPTSALLPYERSGVLASHFGRPALIQRQGHRQNEPLNASVDLPGTRFAHHYRAAPRSAESLKP